MGAEAASRSQPESPNKTSKYYTLVCSTKKKALHDGKKGSKKGGSQDSAGDQEKAAQNSSMAKAGADRINLASGFYNLPNL